MNKLEIAELFEEMALLLELKGENPFKIRAYHNAALKLEELDQDLGKLIREEKLTSLSGIGKDLAEKITILFVDGYLPAYEELKKSIPEGLLEMLGIPGLGAKKIKVLHEKLKVKTLDELKHMCEEGHVASLKGFGEKTEENILRGIENLKIYSRRMLWWKAKEIAFPLLEGLRGLKGVKKAEIAGSFRRRLETVGDLDFLVASDKPEIVMEWFCAQEEVTEVLMQGSTKSSVRLQAGFQADCRVVPLESFPFALHYFTGSKEHNIHLRKLAKEKGLSLSEWGFKPPIKEKITSEKELFSFFSFPYIEPELRENRGEFEAKMPKLVQIEDLKGSFHNHTTESDGRNTLEEMAQAADDLGWEYLGIADHSKSSTQARGLDEERLFAQIEAVKKLNASKKYKVHLFIGNEVDIMNDGSLDFDDEVLKELDYVVVSVHRRFSLTEEEMTKRIIRAIENPYSTMLGHMTGRLLLRREPYSLNIPKVIDAAAANGTIIELNANPYRLDMDWRFWRQAKEKGVMCSINPDAHTIEGLKYVEAGINIARKGWLEKDDVINACSLKDVQGYLNTKSE